MVDIFEFLKSNKDIVLHIYFDNVDRYILTMKKGTSYVRDSIRVKDLEHLDTVLANMLYAVNKDFDEDMELINDWKRRVGYDKKK